MSECTGNVAGRTCIQTQTVPVKTFLVSAKCRECLYFFTPIMKGLERKRHFEFIDLKIGHDLFLPITLLFSCMCFVK